MTVRSPCRLHPNVGLVTETRRYLITGAPAAMPLYSSFIFSLNNRACQQLAKFLLLVEKRSDQVGLLVGCSALLDVRITPFRMSKGIMALLSPIILPWFHDADETF